MCFLYSVMGKLHKKFTSWRILMMPQYMKVQPPYANQKKSFFNYLLPFAIIPEVPAYFPQLKVASSNHPMERCVIKKSDQVLAIDLPGKGFVTSMYTECC